VALIDRKPLFFMKSLVDYLISEKSYVRPGARPTTHENCEDGSPELKAIFEAVRFRERFVLDRGGNSAGHTAICGRNGLSVWEKLTDPGFPACRRELPSCF
jgi:hypothetical protein